MDLNFAEKQMSYHSLRTVIKNYQNLLLVKSIISIDKERCAT